jgi:predicted hydrocarbon binding protein
MALTKGIGFVNVREFVLARFGQAGWDRLVKRSSPAEQAVLESILPVGWYDLAFYTRLIRALDEELGAGDLRLVQALGRFEAERDLTTIQRVFLRLVRPSLAIENMDKYWRRFHDTGAWTTERGPREVTARLSGWGIVDAALCRELVGYLGRTLELLGGRDVFVDHRKCRGKGDELCEFQTTWRASSDRDEAPAQDFEPSPRTFTAR